MTLNARFILKCA